MRRGRVLLGVSLGVALLHGVAAPAPARACQVDEQTFPNQPPTAFGLQNVDPYPSSAGAGPPLPVLFTREVVEPRVLPNGHKPKALLDVDLDGFLDVVARSEGLEWYEYPSWTAHQISAAGKSEDARAVDLDGDGDLDFCFSGKNAGPDCVLNPLSEGLDPRITPWPVETIGVLSGDGGHDIELADIDLDGRVDEIHLFGIFFQDPVGTWIPVDASTILPERGYKGTSLGDIDGDGDLDLVSPSKSKPFHLVWHENPLPSGDPRSEAWVSHPIAGSPKAMTSQVMDLSGDGRPDVIASPLSEPANVANGLVWFEAPPNPRAPDAVWIERSIDPTVGFVHQGSIHAVDMNGDGLRDVVIVEQEQSSSDRLAIYYNHGAGLSWTEQVIANVGGHNSKVGDIDGDGDIDILNANHGNFGEPNPIEIFWNTSTPDAQPPVISGLSVSASATSVTLVWTTDEPASARVDVSQGSSPPRAVARPSFREQHQVVIGGLLCATTYDLAVQAADAAGHLSAVASHSIATTVCGSGVGSVTAGRLALYEFGEGSGTNVADTSGVGPPLDLTIEDPGAVTWLDGALRLDAAGAVASSGPATKIVDSASTSGGISIEAWLDPESDQHDDAAIVSLDGASGANLRFEQPTYGGSTLLRLTLRTQTSIAGSLGVEGPYFAPISGLTHAVFTHGADGTTRLYLDGVLVESNTTRQGSAIADWDPSYGFRLGNREGGGSEWLGTLHRVAVYGRELSGGEVRRNYIAGPGPTACSDGIDNDGDGAVDMGDDAGCISTADTSERQFGRTCDDSIDNDGDGFADFLGDPGCISADDPDETGPAVVPALGGAGAATLAWLMAVGAIGLGRRRQGARRSARGRC